MDSAIKDADVFRRECRFIAVSPHKAPEGLVLFVSTLMSHPVFAIFAKNYRKASTELAVTSVGEAGQATGN
jgi:hypothetical protein